MEVRLSEIFVDEEIKSAVLRVLDSHQFILGEELERFEEEFARYVGTKYAVGVSSGTTAIQCALTALQVKKGDEIIVPSNTTMPTVEPILWLNATPVFAEVDPDSFTLNPESVRRKITKKTKVILPVHLYGQATKMDEILEIAQQNDLPVVEDCAQAHGSRFRGRKVGGIGKIGCFSFYPSKNMTVCGDGGMVVTDDQRLAETTRLLRHHGIVGRYKHVILGSNFRLSEVHSAMGRVQLRHLDDFNMHRRRWADMYFELLKDTTIQLPREMEWAFHVYHLFVVRVKRRDKLLEHLNSKGVQAAIHYPIPCHAQPALRGNPPVSLPITEKLAKEILSLPMHPWLTEEQVSYVADGVKEFQRDRST